MMADVKNCVTFGKMIAISIKGVDYKTGGDNVTCHAFKCRTKQNV